MSSQVVHSASYSPSALAVSDSQAVSPNINIPRAKSVSAFFIIK